MIWMAFLDGVNFKKINMYLTPFPNFIKMKTPMVKRVITHSTGVEAHQCYFIFLSASIFLFIGCNINNSESN